jgi:hypothetical protein
MKKVAVNALTKSVATIIAALIAISAATVGVLLL